MSGKSGSQSTFWRQLRAGDPAGRPLSERAYHTPAFTEGIPVSVLKAESVAVQKETALWWFFANLEPYDLEGEGPFGGYKPTLGACAPAPVRAFEALKDEFDDVLPQPVIMSLGRELGNNWMWIASKSFDPLMGGAAGDAGAALASALAKLADAIRSTSPQHGGIGHNSPPDDTPLAEGDREESLRLIEKAKAANDQAALVDATSRLATIFKRVGEATQKRIYEFCSGFNEEGGRAFAKSLPKLLVVSVALWLDHHLVQETLTAYVVAQAMRQG